MGRKLDSDLVLHKTEWEQGSPAFPQLCHLPAVEPWIVTSPPWLLASFFSKKIISESWMLLQEGRLGVEAEFNDLTHAPGQSKISIA